MRIDGESYRTIWRHPEREGVVQIIDQRKLPFELLIEDLATVEEVAVAIREMYVRGAGLIGATAGYGMHLAARLVSGLITERGICEASEEGVLGMFPEGTS